MTIKYINFWIFGVLALGEVFSYFNSVTAFATMTDNRKLQLQNCPLGNNDPRGSILNIIVSTRLINSNINRVDMEVIYDIDVDSGTLGSFPFPIFDERFGEFRIFTLETDVVIIDNNQTGFDQLAPAIGGGRISVEICYDEPVQDTSAVFKFEANNAVCLHSSGRQALAAGWLSESTSSAIDFVEIDWSIPITPGTPTNLGIDDLDFEPGTDNFFIDQESERDRLNLFLRYDEADLNIRSENAKNIFFFLPVAFFNNEELQPCTEFSGETNLFTIILATVPALACVCLIGLAIGQRYYDRRESERFRRLRENNQNLRHFPGNQDIILLPNAGDGENENNVVQAVLEEEDAQELDDVVPTTTINVRVPSRGSETE